MINRLSVGELATNCWIIPLAKTGSCILVDPGGNADAIAARLNRFALEPRYIVLTHTHFDHVAALPDIAAAWPGAEIAVHRAEAAKLGSLELHRADFGESASYVDLFWKPMPEAGLLLDEGAVLGPFTVLHLPGHSPGSIGLFWAEEKILLSGDTLFRTGTGRTDLPGGDRGLLLQSLKRIAALDGDVQVYPGHGETTTIRRERDFLYGF
jgi:glyoxylase-like metal-dependent hydrolase (beta-lactamase superfamily II)